MYEQYSNHKQITLMHIRVRIKSFSCPGCNLLYFRGTLSAPPTIDCDWLSGSSLIGYWSNKMSVTAISPRDRKVSAVLLVSAMLLHCAVVLDKGQFTLWLQ